MSERTPVDTPANVAEPVGFFSIIRKAFAAVREGVQLATRYRILSNLSNEAVGLAFACGRRFVIRTSKSLAVVPR